MTIVARIVVVGVAMAALSVSALAQKVTHDTNRAADFSQIRTFSIKESPPVDEVAYKTTAYDSPIVRQNTNAAVAAQLEARGLRRDDVHPDVYVTTHRSFQTAYQAWGSPGWGPGWDYPGWGYAGCGYPDQGYPDGAYPDRGYPDRGCGYWDGYYGGYDSYYIQPIIIGTLAVDITSARTGELLWRGISERDMHPTSNPKHRLERINKEVSKVFKKYPTGTVATSGHGTPHPTGQ